MPDGITNVNQATGRYTVTTTETKNGEKVEITKFFAKDGTQIKADYYTAAEISDAANNSDYADYYQTKPVQKDGQYFVAITAKGSFKVGILAKDFIGKVDDGTLSKYNPEYFQGYDAGYTPDGKPLSDSNKEMKEGDTLLIPVDKINLTSPTGWFFRKVITPVYQAAE